MTNGLGQRPIEVLAADDYLVVFDSEATIRTIEPDHAWLSRLDLRGVIVTAPGTEAVISLPDAPGSSLVRPHP